MSQWDEDGSLVCSRCGVTFDVHEWLNPDCPGDEGEPEKEGRENQ